jgi:hypothetical protein
MFLRHPVRVRGHQKVSKRREHLLKAHLHRSQDIVAFVQSSSTEPRTTFEVDHCKTLLILVHVERERECERERERALFLKMGATADLQRTTRSELGYLRARYRTPSPLK